MGTSPEARDPLGDDAEGALLGCGGPRVTPHLGSGGGEAARARRHAQNPRSQVGCGSGRTLAPPSRRPLALSSAQPGRSPRRHRLESMWNPWLGARPRLSGGCGAEAWANGAHLSPERRRIKRRPAGLRLVRACVSAPHFPMSERPLGKTLGTYSGGRKGDRACRRADCVVLRVCRGVGGDAPRLGQGAGHPRITQHRRVGALEPKLHSLGVAG